MYKTKRVFRYIHVDSINNNNMFTILCIENRLNSDLRAEVLRNDPLFTHFYTEPQNNMVQMALF